jgi:hypothetical protein
MIYNMKCSQLIFCVVLVVCCACTTKSQHKNSIDGFGQWTTGHDNLTEQLIPAENKNALTFEDGKSIVHVKFKIKQYGEVSFPIDQQTPEGTEARKADLSKSKFIRITYKANTDFILQLRQTGIHGGTHNHVNLPAAKKYTTTTIALNDFKDGALPIDLTNVAKFNFAFLSNDDTDGFAELKISSIVIDSYEQ